MSTENLVTTDLPDADPLVETWSPGISRNYRLYRALDPVGDQPAIYECFGTEKDINESTGEVVEEVVVHERGPLAIKGQKLLEHCQSKIFTELRTYYEDDAWRGEATAEEALKDLGDVTEEYAKRALDNGPLDTDTATEEEHIYAFDGNCLEFTVNKNALRDDLPTHEYWDRYDWDAVFRAIRNSCGIISELEDDEETLVYRISVDIEDAETWQDRAVQLVRHSVFQNTHALAALAALIEVQPNATQAELAETLGTSPSTVSRQVDDIQDWVTRAEWTASQIGEQVMHR